MIRAPLAFALLVAACGSSSSNHTSADAATSTADAAPGTPDARPFDAPIVFADARPIDGPIVIPDAPPSTPDAPISTPDAATPDSATGGMCFPQCFITATATLVAQCVPSGACTSNTNIQTLTTTICYANGVKLVSTFNFQTATSTVTAKKSNGDVCYSMESSATGQNSARSIWKNAAGTEVARIDIPDTSMGDKQVITCPSMAPVNVDLSTPQCQGERPDAGVGADGGGSSCPMSASCNP